MTISEMHSMFRTIGQQKGMQHIRAILPEEIDDYLNAAIIEFSREVVKKAVNGLLYSAGRSAIYRENGIDPYNAVRTLYDETPKQVGHTLINGHYDLKLTLAGTDYMQIIGVDLTYDKKSEHRYPCRIISPTELANTLNDFCNAPDKENPCCIIDSDVSMKAEFHFYTGGNQPYQAMIHTINMPQKVNYADNVDCNLPYYVHQEIVERAVQKFFTSVGATTQQVKQ